MSGDAGRQAHRDRDKDREEREGGVVVGGAERKCTGVIFDLLHSSGRHCGTLHLISQTLITPDLGSQHYKTALNLGEKKNQNKTQYTSTVIACEGGSSYSSHKHFLRELKFGLEARLIWDEVRACQQKAG